MHANRTVLERGRGQVVLDQLVIPQLHSLVAPVFEGICRHFIWQQGLAGRLPFLPLGAGRWWRINEEIDLVVLGQG